MPGGTAPVGTINRSTKPAAVISWVYSASTTVPGVTLAKPNYNYQKKQKELARQAKQAAKRERRQAKLDETATAETTDAPPPADPPANS